MASWSLAQIARPFERRYITARENFLLRPHFFLRYRDSQQDLFCEVSGLTPPSAERMDDLRKFARTCSAAAIAPGTPDWEETVHHSELAADIRWALTNFLARSKLTNPADADMFFHNLSTLIPQLPVLEQTSLIEDSLRRGRRHFKIKVDEKNLESTVELLAQLQDRHPGASWRFDSNGAFSQKDVPLLENAARKIKLIFWEDPFALDETEAWQRMRASCAVALASDQLDFGAPMLEIPNFVDVAVFKAGLWGTRLEVKNILKSIHQSEKPIYLSSNLESELGSLALLEFARSLPDLVQPPYGLGVTHLYSENYFAHDLLAWLDRLEWRPL